MIKTQSHNYFSDSMNYGKVFTLFLVFVACLGAVSAQTNAENVNLFENSPNDGATISGDDVTFEYGIEEFNDQEGTLKLRAETCTVSTEVLQSNTPPTGTSTTYTHTESYENCYGLKTWYLFYEGADGSVTNSGIYPSFTIESDASQLDTFTASSPSDGDTFEGDINQEADVDFEVAIQTPQDKGDVELVVDGAVVYTWTDVPAGSSQILTTTETISDGSHAWNARFVGVDGSETTTSTNDFTVEDYADRVSLTQTSPSDGESFSSGTSEVTFEYGGSGGGDGDVTLYVNQNPIETNSYSADTSNSYSTTVSGLNSGDYDWYVEYEGDDGSSTTSGTDSFTIEGENSPTFTLDNPSDGEVFNIDPGVSSTTVDYDGSIDAGFSGTLRLIRSGTQVASKSFTSGTTTYTEFSESLSTGNYSYYLEAESDDTGSVYTSNTYDFEIRQSEEVAPTFNLNNPSDGETVTYGEGESSANVSFEGSVDAEYGVDGNLTITGNGVNIKRDFVGTSPETFYAYYESLSEGNYSYNLKVVSSQTGNSYTSQTKDFEVIQTSETQPELSLDVPIGSRSTSVFNETFTYNANVTSEFNGTVNLDLIYPTPPDATSTDDIFVQNLINDFPKVANDSLSLSNIRSFNKNEVLPGTYTFRLQLQSNATGNRYDIEKTLSVSREPTWNYVRPDNVTIDVDQAEDFKETNFEAGINWVDVGQLSYQVKRPGETSNWQTLETFEVQEFRETVKIDFDEVISEISYSSVNDSLVSGNYSGRVLYSADGSGSYSSPSSTFNYEAQPGLLVRVDRWATDTFGEYGTELVATVFIMLSAVYVGLLVPTGGAVLLVIVAEAVFFSIIGFYPSWVAFLLFMLGIGIGYKLFTSGGG